MENPRSGLSDPSAEHRHICATLSRTAHVCYQRMVSQTNDAGVDLTLIDEMLAMTPAERLRMNDQTIRTLLALQEAQEKSDDDDRSVEPAADAG